ncbi:hypothetical protein FRC12_003942 [Ceratobasidium sp. 428]|nr:hypothetical protein FRC12_003942 [Ceratobasidium sp. 428]
MRFAFASFAAIVAATLALAQPRTRASKSINPDTSVAHDVDWDSLPPASEPNTNAKRFAMNLPPLSPKSRRHPQRAAPHRLGTRVQTAPRAQTSPEPPVTQTCYMLTEFGYLSPKFNIFGEYGQFQASPDGAMQVQYVYSPDSPSQMSGRVINDPSTGTFPWFGGVVGFASDSDDFSSDKSNYAYLAGTQHTDPGSPAMVGDSSFGTATGIPGDYQSSIWTYHPESKSITAQWINTDGSAPHTEACYANDGNDALLLTSSCDTLNNEFGTNYPSVSFTCVPVVTQEPARH